LLAKQAEKARVEKQKNPHRLNSDNEKKIDTKKHLIEKANAGHDTINKVERIDAALKENPDPELKEKLINGDVSINQTFEHAVKKKRIIATKFTGENEWVSATLNNCTQNKQSLQICR